MCERGSSDISFINSSVKIKCFLFKFIIISLIVKGWILNWTRRLLARLGCRQSSSTAEAQWLATYMGLHTPLGNNPQCAPHRGIARYWTPGGHLNTCRDCGSMCFCEVHLIMSRGLTRWSTTGFCNILHSKWARSPTIRVMSSPPSPPPDIFSSSPPCLTFQLSIRYFHITFIFNAQEKKGYKTSHYRNS